MKEVNNIIGVLLFIVWLIISSILLAKELISFGEWLISASILVGLYFNKK